MLSQNQKKQKKDGKKKPLLRKIYKKLSKVNSFISRLRKSLVG
jgi:hypothetical protein